MLKGVSTMVEAVLLLAIATGTIAGIYFFLTNTLSNIYTPISVTSNITQLRERACVDIDSVDLQACTLRIRNCGVQPLQDFHLFIDFNEAPVPFTKIDPQQTGSMFFTVKGTFSYDGWNFSVNYLGVLTVKDMDHNITHFFVVDHPFPRVHVFNQTGYYITNISGDIPTTVVSPKGIVVTPAGDQLWILDNATKQVYCFNSKGVKRNVCTFPIPQVSMPKGIAYDNSDPGNPALWILESNPVTIDLYKYSTSGNLLTTVSLSGLISPEAVKFDGISFWILDSFDKKVYRYNAIGIYDNFTFNTSVVSSTPVGIATNGIKVWILDSNRKAVYRFGDIGIIGPGSHKFFIIADLAESPLRTFDLKPAGIYTFSSTSVQEIASAAKKTGGGPPGDPKPDDAGSVTVTPTDKDKLKLSDDVRWVTEFTGSSHWQKFRFKIGENVNTLQTLNIRWEGFANFKKPSGCTVGCEIGPLTLAIYIWNFNTSLWRFIDQNSLMEDRNITVNIFRDFNQYINATSDMFILVHNSEEVASNLISTDYISVETVTKCSGT